MYTGKLNLTNKRRTPLSLSNEFDDTFALEDAVRQCKTPDEFCKAVNKLHRYDYTWSIDNDNLNNTRLTCEDCFGNIHYLIAVKEAPEKNTQVGMKKKIIDTITWYLKAEDKDDVVLARQNAQVLIELLQEIVVN